jgi:hypothetical protein
MIRIHFQFERGCHLSVLFSSKKQGQLTWNQSNIEQHRNRYPPETFTSYSIPMIMKSNPGKIVTIKLNQTVYQL